MISHEVVAGTVSYENIGKIISWGSDTLVIAAKGGLVKIYQLQSPGKKPMDIRSIWCGSKQLFTIGTSVNR